MKTKVGEAEVEIVSVEIQFGVKMPIDVIVKKTRSYGGELEYDVRPLSVEFGKNEVSDVMNIGSKIYAQAIETVKKFEENEEELDLATEIDGIGKRKKGCD